MTIIGGINSGYAKFETFPIWNLPLKHPVNIAYEAATADIRDFNMIDPFHLEAYNEKTVNYNRDVEVFPVLKRILKKIRGGETVINHQRIWALIAQALPSRMMKSPRKQPNRK